MDKHEAKKLLQIVSALYPNWKPDNLDLTVEAWSAVLADEDAQTMANALKIFAKRDESGFAPSPGQLLKFKQSAQMRMYEAKLMEKQYGLLPGWKQGDLEAKI